MKNILLVILLFACSISTAQTATPTISYGGAVYAITGEPLLTIANSYARGYREGITFGRYNCNQNTFVELIEGDGSGDVNIGTHISNQTEGLAATSIIWELLRFNGERIDISNMVSNEGDISFGYRAANAPPQLGGGRLDPVDGFVQHGDRIIVTYRDPCGVYLHEYVVPSSAPAARSGGRRNRPPKIKRPII